MNLIAVSNARLLNKFLIYPITYAQIRFQNKICKLWYSCYAIIVHFVCYFRTLRSNSRYRIELLNVADYRDLRPLNRKHITRKRRIRYLSYIIGDAITFFPVCCYVEIAMNKILDVAYILFLCVKISFLTEQFYLLVDFGSLLVLICIVFFIVSSFHRYPRSGFYK